MKNSEILNLTTEEIIAQIAEERSTLSKLKFAHAVSAIENPNRIKFARKTIARLETELSSRKVAEATTEANEIATEK
ncbi:50S ribosomal protein L29 [Albibacterium indicum]|uniref:50S ribosomal protein L29 n=1 Tax=Albibacterium indicum TaxID=2292082 RepID=UPI000E533552|nr:50S ribosomal protein L29 [Pedobacter indicus]